MEASPSMPPDGGWGWMVVLGAALINMVNQALFSVFGLIFGEELKAMSEGKATGLAEVMSISVMVTNFAGLTVGPLLKKLNIRTITIIGVSCTGTGMIISSFGTKTFHIIIGYGFFTGLGLGLLTSVTFLAINDYFTERKSTAVGLAMAGTSIGQMIMPSIVGVLMEKYGFSGTTFALGMLSYSGIIGAMLFKPVFCCKGPQEPDPLLKSTSKLSNSSVAKENYIKIPTENDSTKQSKSLTRENSQKVDCDNNNLDTAEDVLKCDEEEKRKGCWGKMMSIFNLHLLEDKNFLVILVGLGLGYISTITFSTFFPMFLQDEVNFTMFQTTSCMTTLSFADIAGRITVSEIARKLNLKSKGTFMFGGLILGICRSFMVEMKSYYAIITASFMIGYFRATTVITQNLIISEYIKKDELPSAVGLNMVTKAILIISFGQVIGFLKDAFSYRTCIHLIDIILYTVIVLWSLELYLSRKRRKNNENPLV